jgi:hypothetical protein
MELVSSKDFFEIIDREYPDSSYMELERMCGYGNGSGVLSNTKRVTKWITLEKADRILTALGLSHYLSTGDLKVEQAFQIGLGGELIYEKGNRKIVPSEWVRPSKRPEIRSRDDKIRKLRRKVADLERQLSSAL